MTASPGPGDEDEVDDDGGEWRFSLADIEARNREPEGDEQEEGGNVAGSFAPTGEIEAGDVDLENALFVLVGVALAVLALVGFMNILP